jgi:hypothetical protein
MHWLLLKTLTTVSEPLWNNQLTKRQISQQYIRIWIPWTTPTFGIKGALGLLHPSLSPDQITDIPSCILHTDDAAFHVW